MKRTWKRIWALCLAAVLMAGTLPMAAALESTCPRCGTVMDETVVQPTCITDGRVDLVCPACGGTGTRVGNMYGKALGHDYGRSGICSRCGDDARPPDQRPGSGISSTGPDGHTHNYKLTGNMYATQTREGVKVWVCSICQDKQIEDVPKLSADGTAQPGGGVFRPSGGSGTSSGTTTTPGGSSSSGSGSAATPGGGSTTTPGTGTTACSHTWTTSSKAATCTEDGYVYQVCTICGQRGSGQAVPKLGHAYQSRITTPAAPGVAGLRTYTCTRCGHSYTEAIPALPAPQVTPVDPNAAPGHSDRGVSIKAVGSGYEMIRVDGDLIYNVDTKQYTDNRKLLVEFFDAEFKKTGSKQLEIELREIAGSYFGQDYNFFLFGQDNFEQDTSKEVLRIVKYSKNWERLGAASLRNVGITDIVGQHGNRAFAECNGMLYIRSGRTTDKLSDGRNHQTNMTICIRESDMAITDSQILVSNPSTGYVSHSMSQDIMVDCQGNLITLDTGDAHPRGAYLFRYPQKAGGEKFTGAGTGAILTTWPGESGNVNTGGRACSLAETREGYLSAYVDTGNGSNYNPDTPYSAYLVFTPRDNISASASVTRTVMRGTAQESAGHVYLIPTSLDSGYVLWYTEARANGFFSFTAGATMYYAKYSADGSFGPVTKLDSSLPLPFEGPIYTGGKLVWGGDSSRPDQMQFCTLDDAGNVKVYGSSGQTKKNPFTDVPAGSYYHDAVLWALEKGITTGVTATQFQPNSACTRGQVVTFLWRAKGSPEPATKVNPFRDVYTSSPYYKAILWAYENNITLGTTAATFSPNTPCTNGHVVTFLWRANGKPAASGFSSLASTYSPNAYYTNAVAWADAKGLLSGVGSSFVPGWTSPRANIVTYLYRDIAQ